MVEGHNLFHRSARSHPARDERRPRSVIIGLLALVAGLVILVVAADHR